MPAPCTKIESFWDTCKFNFSYPCGISGTWWKPWTWKIKWCNMEIPYTCLKKRQIAGTGYHCSYIRMECWGFVCFSFCCENGIEYGSWKGPAFLMFGEKWNKAGGSFCFKEPLDNKGECKKPPADPQDNSPWEPPVEYDPDDGGTVSGPGTDSDIDLKLVGLGDIVKAITMRFGIKPCESCKRRKEILNRGFSIGIYKTKKLPNNRINQKGQTV